MMEIWLQVHYRARYYDTANLYELWFAREKKYDFAHASFYRARIENTLVASHFKRAEKPSILSIFKNKGVTRARTY